MLSVQPIESVGYRIRELFAQAGGAASATGFARICIERGVWSPEELDGFTLRAAAQVIRKELKAHDATGMAFAGPSVERDDEGARVWKQRFLWDPETYAAIIGDLDTRISSMQTEREKYLDECVERFGYVPGFA